ncbi:MAG: hypothetical protein QOI67_1173 [Gaiellaceae bacterium]|jgi:hypothetical protein|nr:hypothetical protein [Gaiellaceae bacterium]
MRVRVALTLLVLVTATTLLGCGGGDGDAPAEPLSLQARLPADEEAAGFRVQNRFTWPNVDGPVEEGFAPTLNRPELRDEAKKVLRDAGYVEGVAVLRSRAANDNFVVMVLRLGSESGARDVLEWMHREELTPCPDVCSVKISEFEVGGIDHAKGIQRLVGPPVEGQESPPTTGSLSTSRTGPSSTSSSALRRPAPLRARTPSSSRKRSASAWPAHRFPTARA